MKLSNKVIFILLLIVIVMFAVPYRCTEHVYKTDTVYYTKTDTVHDTIKLVKVQPKIKTVETLKTDTVINCKGDTFELITEEKRYLDTLVYDKDTAIVNATVSGIRANLDTVTLELRKYHVFQTNTTEIIKYVKPKRFYISPQIGLGYGMTSKTFDMYVGIGIGVRL